MKKYIAYMLCVCLITLLCACTTPDGTTPETTTPTVTTSPVTTPTTAPVTSPQTSPEIPQIPLAAVTLTPITETNPDNGFAYTYPDIHLLLPDPHITSTVTLELLNRIDATRAAAEDIAASGGSENGLFYSVQYDPMRIDSGVLSLFGSHTSYAGGMHPNSECVSVTYDLTTGQTLLLTDILSLDCTAADLSPLVVDALAAESENTYLYSDYPTIVEERFAQDLNADKGWFLSNKGLCFYFSPYEVAPYSSGIITAVIPYENLIGLLRDAYFPVEKSGSTGTVEATLFQNSNTSQFEQFAEVVLDKGGEAILLYTEGLVYDVTLELGSWDMDGTVFTPDATVFSAGSLTPRDGVLIQAYLPDVMPNLRLTYTTSYGTVQKYIFQSGMDGSILLLDE